MFRKLILALGAAAVIGAAALTPTTASAWGGGWHHGHGHGHFGRGFAIGFYGPGYVVGPSCYIVRRVVDTPYGPRLRRFEVCD